MPKYHSWEEQGLKVKVRDQNIWKRKFTKWNFYYIGDIVKLVISIERLSPEATPINNIFITEKTPQSDKYIARKPEQKKAWFTGVILAIRGDVLDEPGDDLWRLEIRKNGKIEWSRKIFDAGISNRDNHRRDIILVALAFLFALPSCIIAAFQLWIEYLSYIGK